MEKAAAGNEMKEKKEKRATAKTAEKLKLSIIMPVRNEGANLKMTLKIINALIEAPYEVLVV